MTTATPKLAPFKLERYFAQYEFNAPYLLCSSDCESLAVSDLLALEPGSEEGLRNQWLGYTESQGLPALREEITKLYPGLYSDNILVHAGAEEAIHNFMLTHLQPGDHAIVHWPCYQSLAEIAKATGAQLSLWHTHEENNWALDLDWLRNNIQDSTKLVVVNCPHNPTGYVMTEAEQRELIAICRNYNITLFSDEVYRGLELDPADTLPPAASLYENAVSLGVMSKSYGLAGLRIGWIATQNRTIYQAMANYKDYTSICNSAPSEYLSLVALKHGQRLIDRNRQIIGENVTHLNTFFAKYPQVFKWQMPKSGPVAFPSLITGQSMDDFAHDLVTQQGVLLLPSSMYDYGTKNFRLGFGRKNLPQALEQLDIFIKGL